MVTLSLLKLSKSFKDKAKFLQSFEQFIVTERHWIIKSAKRNKIVAFQYLCDSKNELRQSKQKLYKRRDSLINLRV